MEYRQLGDGVRVDIDKDFEEIRKGQENLKGKVVVNRDMVIDRGKGKEYQVDFENGIIGSYRLFTVGNKGYEMRVEGKGMTLDNPDVKKFFGSFNAPAYGMQATVSGILKYRPSVNPNTERSTEDSRIAKPSPIPGFFYIESPRLQPVEN
jgi:hypothetical protein